jgi:hypothetical protein
LDVLAYEIKANKGFMAVKNYHEISCGKHHSNELISQFTIALQITD